MIPKHRPPSHPGEILSEEFLKPLGLSQDEFAAHLGGSWTQPKLSAIINKKRAITQAITQAIALDFADAFGTTPEFWLHLQSNYDLWKAVQDHKKIPLLDCLKAA